MNKRDIEPFDYAQRIAEAIPRGVLLTTKAHGEVNTMVIGWGFLGTVWGVTTFIAYVRTSRHTYDLLEENPQFTINVPLEKLDGIILACAGIRSGRDLNKIDHLNLELVDGTEIDVPAIYQAPLTLECEVLYKHEIDLDNVPEDFRINYYPENVTDIDKGANCYTHMVYYGEVLESYILEAN